MEALRALDEERATDDPLNGLILSAGLTWRDVEVLRTLRNHLLQIRPHYNVETVNGVLLRNAAAAGALHARSPPASTPPRPGTGRPRWRSGRRVRRGRSRRCAAWPRTRSCAPSTTS